MRFVQRGFRQARLWWLWICVAVHVVNCVHAKVQLLQTSDQASAELISVDSHTVFLSHTLPYSQTSVPLWMTFQNDTDCSVGFSRASNGTATNTVKSSAALIWWQNAAACNVWTLASLASTALAKASMVKDLGEPTLDTLIVLLDESSTTPMSEPIWSRKPFESLLPSSKKMTVILVSHDDAVLLTSVMDSDQSLIVSTKAEQGPWNVVFMFPTFRAFANFLFLVCLNMSLAALLQLVWMWREDTLRRTPRLGVYVVGILAGLLIMLEVVIPLTWYVHQWIRALAQFVFCVGHLHLLSCWIDYAQKAWKLRILSVYQTVTRLGTLWVLAWMLLKLVLLHLPDITPLRICVEWAMPAPYIGFTVLFMSLATLHHRRYDEEFRELATSAPYLLYRLAWTVSVLVVLGFVQDVQVLERLLWHPMMLFSWILVRWLSHMALVYCLMRALSCDKVKWWWDNVWLFRPKKSPGATALLDSDSESDDASDSDITFY